MGWAPSSWDAVNISSRKYVHSVPKRTKPFDRKLLNLGFSLYYRSKYEHLPKYGPKSIDACVEALRKSSSAGHYFKGKKGDALKSDWDKVMRRFHWLRTAPIDEVLADNIWTVFPKEEFLPMEKIGWKERSIACCCVALNMYTQWAVGAHFDDCIDMWHLTPNRIGISPFFDNLASLYVSHHGACGGPGQNIHIATDITGQETAFTQDVHELIWEWRATLAKYDCQKVACRRLAKIHSCWQAKLPNGKIVQVYNIEPSGSGSTAQDNTDFQLSVLFVAWYTAWLRARQSRETERDFFDSLFLSGFGDDGLNTVSAALFAHFNEFQSTVSRFFGLKIEATDPSVWSLPFLSKTVDGPLHGPRNVQPHKLMNTLLYKTTTPSLSAEIAGCVYNEIALLTEGRIVETFCDWLEQKYKVKCPRASAPVIKQMYQPGTDYCFGS